MCGWMESLTESFPTGVEMIKRSAISSWLFDIYYDMIFLVETWCQPNNMLNSELCSDILQHYHMERKDNTDDVRGGILMYFHKSLDAFNCDELNDFS